jgi:hypothetical protein
MNPSLFDKATSQTYFDTTYLNVDYFFVRILHLWEYVKSFHASNVIYTASYILTLFGITITLYALVRLVELNKEEFGHLQHAIHEAHEREKERQNGKNPRWTYVENLMLSTKDSDWRLAIIEADSMLEEALESRGISGDGIGEKLKNSTPGDLASLPAAWEAHLVRNNIAHEGSAYDLSQREARRTIQLYEVVFRELGYL